MYVYESLVDGFECVLKNRYSCFFPYHAYMYVCICMGVDTHAPSYIMHTCICLYVWVCTYAKPHHVYLLSSSVCATFAKSPSLSLSLHTHTHTLTLTHTHSRIRKATSCIPFIKHCKCDICEVSLPVSSCSISFPFTQR